MNDLESGDLITTVIDPGIEAILTHEAFKHMDGRHSHIIVSVDGFSRMCVLPLNLRVESLLR